jgi:HK97 family phage prohead protease
MAGTFEATVAVFNNVDKGGDRIIPGAFAKTLAQWEASGDPIPVIFNHDWGPGRAHRRRREGDRDRPRGLFVKGRLDVADNDGREGRCTG